MARITKKSLYEGLAKAGYAYITAFDIGTGRYEKFMFLTSIYDPGELLGYVALSEDKQYAIVGAVDTNFKQTWGVRRRNGVPRFNAESVVTEFQTMRSRMVHGEITTSRLVDKVKEGRK